MSDRPPTITWDDVHSFWNDVDPAEAARRNFYYRWLEWPQVINALAPGAGESLVEFGSGWISTVPLMLVKRFGCAVTCVDRMDLDADRRQRIDDALVRLGFSDDERARLILKPGDASSIDLPDGAFDGAYSISTVEHIPDEGDTAAIRSLARAVRPGGRIVVSVPWVFGPPIENDLSEGVEHRQRWYNRETFAARLVEPAGLAVRNAFFVAETRPAFGRAFRTLGTRGRLAFSRALRPWSDRLWRIALRLDGDGFAGLEAETPPVGVEVDRGAIVAVLEHAAVPPKRAVARSPSRRFLPGTLPETGGSRATDYAGFVRRLGPVGLKLTNYKSNALVAATLDAVAPEPGGRVLAWVPGVSDLAPLYLANASDARIDAIYEEGFATRERNWLTRAARRAGLTADSGARLRFPDADALTGEFDRIVTVGVFERRSVEGARALIRRLASHLAPGGRIVLGVPLGFGDDAASGPERSFELQTLRARIVEPAGLRVRRFVFLGERVPGIGRLIGAAGPVGGFLSSTVFAAFAGRLWTRFLDLSGREFDALEAGAVPFGVPVTRGVCVVVLAKERNEEPTRPPRAASDPRPATWRRIARMFARPTTAKPLRWHWPSDWAWMPEMINATGVDGSSRVLAIVRSVNPVVPFYLVRKRGARVDVVADQQPTDCDRTTWSRMARAVGFTPGDSRRLRIDSRSEPPRGSYTHVVSQGWVESVEADEVKAMARRISDSLVDGGRAGPGDRLPLRTRRDRDRPRRAADALLRPRLGAVPHRRTGRTHRRAGRVRRLTSPRFLASRRVATAARADAGDPRAFAARRAARRAVPGPRRRGVRPSLVP